MPVLASKMKISWWIPFTFLASTVSSTSTFEATEIVTEIPLLPFTPPQDVQATNSQRAFRVLQLLRKRADNCPNGYKGCSNMGNSQVCCQDNARCTKDNANNIACCPTGASCTGILGRGAGSSGATQTSSSFLFPQPVGATPTTTSNENPQVTGSTLSGAAYPFIYVPTTFPNAAMCSAYYSACQTDFVRCTSALGSQYRVTVGGNDGGGLTVGGAPAASEVASTCSSLSMSACHGLQIANCPSYGGQAGDTGNSASGVRVANLKDLMLALVVGVTGMFI